MMKKKILLILVVVLCIALTAGCGSKADISERYKETDNVYSEIKNNSAQSATGNKPSLNYSKTAEDIADPADQMLIKSCSIYAETKAFDDSIADIEAKIAAVGGYIEYKYSNGSSYGQGKTSRRLVLTVRVPASRLTEFTDGVSDIVNVTSFTQNVENITEEYYDTSAKLETLKTERDSLLEMMKSLNTANEYDFWYKLHTRISEIEQQIASYEGKIKNYDKLVAFSSVSIELREVIEYTETSEYTFFDRIKEAFNGSWVDFAYGCQDFAVFMIEAFPTLLVLAAVGVVIWLIIRGIVRNSKKKRAKKAAEAVTK